MREIKFRAWDNMNKTMYQPTIPPNGVSAKTTIMQFTGFKDCVGREIYEGDILICTMPGTFVTMYSDELGAFVMVSIKDQNNMIPCHIYSRRGIIYIIGNIHKNPELLEAKNAKEMYLRAVL